MGFWKDVAYDMSRGMSEQSAVALNAELKYGDKQKAVRMEAEFEAELVINTMR